MACGCPHSLTKQIAEADSHESSAVSQVVSGGGSGGGGLVAG